MDPRISLITVQPDRKAYIPVQNFQGLTIKLDEGVQLGVASLCDIPRQDEPVNEQSLSRRRVFRQAVPVQV